ncbi:UDP-phosphate N-acetylglucosaminyl 1-phosphate transferase [Klebsiella sp. RIT-PI-d]|uniref:UDP-N-acetylglucosamine--undecaprenyl-phosphate N-acetylglucosaminephosphotransferase n=1 Tax=Klebsiella sp. RIT-PI-d TaxID=1681196 RepID=UPI0006767898|nr:UDP-N-acetylglucosamine--undecaprenyl-phosphate N-acetylglucosaminephosphotransferase [Klebsiella sp. RIT-PI-d]KNC09910.1 UDP-phosphate N-acetylglucosaminyl 1-phosphate transferase [Klebsiella sp. RIT-PI-d]
MDFVMILLSAVGGLTIARFTAPVFGLVDKPDARKVHEGHIPLVGGISVWVAISALQYINPQWLPHQQVFWFCISMLLIVGVLDDRFNLPVLPRVIAQAIAAALMMRSGLWLASLGEIIPGYVVTLGAAGYLVTLIAIWASINAFNMIDGIDGLLGAVSCVTFGALGILFYLHGNIGAWHWCLALVLAVMPYLMANLGLFGGKKRKVFMGDAGSTVIGFAVIWLLVVATQNEDAVIAPVTALWLIALPLADMSAVSLRRLLSGNSPFRPDRGHIHHIIMKCGYSSRWTLVILFVAAVFCASIGILFDRLQIAEWVSLTLFLLFFAGWVRFSMKVFHR